ncbi:MAG TPA: anti-sigma factor antagonist [Planctomycetes bacterium]|nr:anti-sigma factor antagonist [Planctomycetota bacterium]
MVSRASFTGASNSITSSISATFEADGLSSAATKPGKRTPRYAMEIVGKKSQGLSVTALKDDKTVIISFNDRSLNFYVTDSLKESLKETINTKIEEGCSHFVLNLDNVKIIDSCGVGLIIVANNVTSSRNCKLYLSNIKPFIVKIFEIMRISKHLAIYDKEDDALQAIKNGN